jgi:hypothetical protein
MKKFTNLVLALFAVSLFISCTSEEVGPKGLFFTVDGKEYSFPVVEGFKNTLGTYTIKAHHNDTAKGQFLIVIPEMKSGKYNQDNVTLSFNDDDKNYFTNHFSNEHDLSVDITSINYSGNKMTGVQATFSGKLDMFAVFSDSTIHMTEGSINF